MQLQEISKVPYKSPVCLGQDVIRVLINLHGTKKNHVNSSGLLVTCQQLWLVMTRHDHDQQVNEICTYNARKVPYIWYVWDKMLSISMHMVQRSTVRMVLSHQYNCNVVGCQQLINKDFELWLVSQWTRFVHNARKVPYVWYV